MSIKCIFLLLMNIISEVNKITFKSFLLNTHNILNQQIKTAIGNTLQDGRYSIWLGEPYYIHPSSKIYIKLKTGSEVNSTTSIPSEKCTESIIQSPWWCSML